MASAQAPAELAGKPDQGFWLAADSAVDDGEDFLIPADSEVGVPILWPPDGGYLLMGGGGGPTVEVVRPRLVWNQQEEEWEYDWDPVLCPRKKAPGNCQGGSLVARGGPYPGGTYNWEFDETQHNDVAFYQSTQTGLTYYTWVSYTNWGKTSQEAGTGFIRVFDADLTFQDGSSDPQDTVEDDPGFFMALGTRKSLSLSLDPADPDDVMPRSFDEDLHPRGLLPPYQVWVSGGYPCIDFYAAQEGGNPLTGEALLWGWKEVAWEVFEETPAPAQIYVQAETPGTCTVDLWLMFRCPQECGDWLAETDSAGDTVKLSIVAVDLDIDGVDEPVEEDPGGFVALGGSRKKITLSVLPSTVRPVDLYVTAADSKVALYAGPAGGDRLGNHLHFDVGEPVPIEVWVEGVEGSGSLQDIELTLDASPGGQHATDIVKFTVLTVETVEWTAVGGGELEFNNHPDTTVASAVGVRTYPDATQPGGAWNDDVWVQATIKPAVEGQRVYFAVFDPDDPSADNNEVDDDTLGGDNRGGRGELFGANWGVTTIAEGTCTCTKIFTVAHKPGDNHRVAAMVLDEWPLFGLNDNNVPASNEQVPTFPGKILPLLTVWRKLHMDLDSMGPVTGNYVQGTVLDVTHEPNNPLPQGPRTRLDLSDFEPDSFDEDNHFWTPSVVPGGTIKLFKAGPPATPWLTVLDNDEHWGDEALYVAMDTGLDVYEGGEYLLRDDDWEDLPGRGSATAPPVDLSSPHCLKTDIVTNAMAYAYVTVEQYGEVQVSQFRLNVELNQVNWASENLNAASTSQFWVAHLTAAFQGRQNGDADSERAWGIGATLPGHSGHCYLETIREWWANGATQRSIDENEAENVAHEVGHQFGLEHEPDGAMGVYGNNPPKYYLMAGEEDLGQRGDRDFQVHEPPALAAIRNSDHPVVEP